MTNQRSPGTPLPAIHIRKKRISFRLDGVRHAAIIARAERDQTTITQVVTTAIDMLFQSIRQTEDIPIKTINIKKKGRRNDETN